jgi:hypothetical protein
MTERNDPRALTPVGEAQLLLTRHEPWSTETGAYLESDDVLILIEAQEPLPAEVEGFHSWPVPGTDAVAPGGLLGTSVVDVLITLRSRRRPSALRDLPIELVGADGRTVSGRVGARGQVRFPGLPAGTWRTRLGPAAAAIDDAPAGATATVIPFRRISRLLADAAASGARHVRDVLTSPDDEVVTEVEETDEGRLVATFTAAGRPGLVRLRWSLVQDGAPGTPRTLVTPLAERPEGGGVAKYDLGPVVEAIAIDVAPAERLDDPAELDAEDVRAAFDLVLYGSALRAWQEYAASGDCPAELRPLIAEALAQQ